MTEGEYRVRCAWGSLQLRIGIERLLGKDGGIRTMQTVTANTFGIPLHDMLGRSRKPEFAAPRQVAMYLARKKGWSWPYVGKRFERDHTTAIHAFKATAQRMARDEQFAATVRAIEERLG